VDSPQARIATPSRDITMGKSQDARKQTMKKPQKTAAEKKAEKRAKKSAS